MMLRRTQHAAYILAELFDFTNRYCHHFSPTKGHSNIICYAHGKADIGKYFNLDFPWLISNSRTALAENVE
jgi:hypothetical protein